MTRTLIIGLIAVAVLAAAIGAWEKMRMDAMQAGIDRQRAAEIAQANQNIATRRETDAHFDKMDAAAVCRDFGLEWVYDGAKSICR